MIEITRYKAIADNLANNYDYNDHMVTYLQNAYDILDAYLSSDTEDNEYIDATRHGMAAQELLSILEEVWERDVDSRRIDIAKIQVEAVSAMHKHVNFHYGSINNFLSDNNTKVKQGFATLSEKAGYTIEASNIE